MNKDFVRALGKGEKGEGEEGGREGGRVRNNLL